MKKYFEYIVVYNPSITRDANGNETQGPDVLIVKPTGMLARDDKEVGMRAAREIPEGYLDKLDCVHVCIRPF